MRCERCTNMNHQNKDITREAETTEAVAWLRTIAERAALNRRESGRELTPQIKDVLAIQTGSVAIYASVRSLQRVCVALAASIVAMIAFGGIASYRFFQL